MPSMLFWLVYMPYCTPANFALYSYRLACFLLHVIINWCELQWQATRQQRLWFRFSLMLCWRLWLATPRFYHHTAHLPPGLSRCNEHSLWIAAWTVAGRTVPAAVLLPRYLSATYFPYSATTTCLPLPACHLPAPTCTCHLHCTACPHTPACLGSATATCPHRHHYCFSPASHHLPPATCLPTWLGQALSWTDVLPPLPALLHYLPYLPPTTATACSACHHYLPGLVLANMLCGFLHTCLPSLLDVCCAGLGGCRAYTI